MFNVMVELFWDDLGVQYGMRRMVHISRDFILPTAHNN